jgi:hypothetical protein
LLEFFVESSLVDQRSRLVGFARAKDEDSPGHRLADTEWHKWRYRSERLK